MVSKDKEFEYVTSQIIKHVERSVDAFKMFAQLFSAIVGGSILLAIPSPVSAQRPLKPTRISRKVCETSDFHRQYHDIRRLSGLVRVQNSTVKASARRAEAETSVNH